MMIYFRECIESAELPHIWFGEGRAQCRQSILATQPKSSSYFLHT